MARLTVTNAGVIQRDGVDFKNVGLVAYHLLSTLLNNSASTQYLTDIPQIASYGVKVLRVFVTPYWPAEWAATYDTNPTQFWNSTDAFMNALAANDILILANFFPRAATVPDLKSERVPDLANPASASRVYMDAFLTSWITRYKNHAAFGGTLMGNEWNGNVVQPGLPGVDLSQGTRASYSAPADTFSRDTYLTYAKDFCAIVRANDPTVRALIAPANIGTTGSVRSLLELQGQQFLDGPDIIRGAPGFTCSGTHLYRQSRHISHDFSSAEQILAATAAFAASHGQGFVIDETGLSTSYTYADAPEATAFDNILRIFRQAGNRIGIMTVWNWMTDADAVPSGMTDNNIYPGNARDFMLAAIRDANASTGGIPSSVQNVTGKLPTYGKLAARTDGSTGYVSIANDAQLNTAAFSIALRLRKGTRTTSSGYLISKGNGSNAGWSVRWSSASPDSQIYLRVDNAAGSSFNTASAFGALFPGDWVDALFTFDGSNLIAFRDFLYVQRVAFTGTYNPSTNPLTFFADQSGANFGKGDMAQIKFWPRALSDIEVASYGKGNVPDGAYSWDLNGNAIEASGSGMNGTVNGSVPYVSGPP